MSTTMSLIEKVLRLLGQDGPPTFSFQSSILPIILVQVVCFMAIVLYLRQSRSQLEKKSDFKKTTSTNTSLVLALISLTTAFSIWSSVDIEWRSIKTMRRMSDFDSKAGTLPNLFNASIRELQYGLESGQ